MDFAVCPACGQSVLDDDAVDCPFCGASMSGKPVKKPAAAAPQRKKSAAATPTAAKPPKPSQPEPPADPQSNTIAADTEAAGKAIPVRSQRAKGLVLRVQCPMCETEGWVPAKAAGREVRCANKECLVPLFTAPELPKKKVEEPEKVPSNISWPIVGTAIAGVVAAAGAGLWYAMQPPVPDFLPGAVVVEPAPRDPIDDSDGPTPIVEAPKVPTLAEVRGASFAQMVELAQSAPRAEKPTARQRAVVAHARLGDIAAAREQFERLRYVSNAAGLKFYEVDGLAEIAWAELRAGDRAAATRTAQQALESVVDAPRSGRSVTLALANLAALLQAVGQGKDVPGVLGRDRDDIEDQRIALRLLLARVTRSYDLDREVRIAPFPAPTPGNVHAQLVTAQLGEHDRWDDVLAYAAGQGDKGDRTQCLALVAELLAARAPADAEARIDAVVGKLQGPDAAYAMARVAVRRLTGGDVGIAKPSLERAASLLPTDEPRPAQLPGAKSIYDGSHGYADRPPFAFLATAEVARARAIEATLGAAGDRDVAWATYLTAIRRASAVVPSFESTSAKLAAAERGDAAIKSEIAAALNASSADAYLVDYKEHLRTIDTFARNVRDLKGAVLADAAHRGLATRVNEAITGGDVGESSKLLLATPLGVVLRLELPDGDRQGISKHQIARYAPEKLVGGEFDPRALAAELAAKSDEAGAGLLQLSSLLNREQGRAKGIEFLVGLNDPYTQAEGTLLVEAASAAKTAPHVAWRELEATKGLGGLATITAIEGLLLATDGHEAESPPVVDTANPAANGDR